ncbi:hypothetical protein ACTXT7_001938, partial [Hymenolepis weldensis]
MDFLHHFKSFCFLFALTPEVAELGLGFIAKQSKTPDDDLKLAILECAEKPESQLGERLLAKMRKKPQSTQTDEPQHHKNERDKREWNPLKTDNDDMSSTTTTPEKKFDAEQFRTYDREHCKEPPFVAGDSNSKRDEKKQCPPEQALATRKRWARRKRNAQKPEVTTPPKLQLQQYAILLYLADKASPGLCNLNLIQPEGRISSPSETDKPSTAVQPKLSLSQKTLQRAAVNLQEETSHSAFLVYLLGYNYVTWYDTAILAIRWLCNSKVRSDTKLLNLINSDLRILLKSDEFQQNEIKKNRAFTLKNQHPPTCLE